MDMTIQCFSCSMDGLNLSLGEDLLDVGNGLVEDLLLELGVLNLLVDLGNDGLGELALLALADLTLVADPRVKDRAGLGGKVNLLLELKGLGLELNSLLGQSKEILGGRDNVLELRDRVDALLNGNGVGLASLVEDALDVLNLAVGPRGVAGRGGLAHHKQERGKDAEETGLGVDDVEAVGDGVNKTGGTGSEDAALGQRAVAGQGINDRLGLGLGVLGGVAAKANAIVSFVVLMVTCYCRWDTICWFQR